jgi:hypothetical protein
MIYFLFFDGALSQFFVIEGDDDWVMEDAWVDASAVVDDEDELEYIGIVSGEEVDKMRYDVY